MNNTRLPTRRAIISVIKLVETLSHRSIYKVVEAGTLDEQAINRNDVPQDEVVW